MSSERLVEDEPRPGGALAEPGRAAGRSGPARGPGRLRLGGEAHKTLFCQMLLTTHDPYKPAVIDWPRLDDEARNKVVSLPIWDIAVQTEARAGLNVGGYAKRVEDPLLKAAVEMNAFEETRHKQVLANMVEAYGIKLEPEPAYRTPRDVEWAFMVTGFSECIDSFFAFGLFDIAKTSGFFPPELVDTFEPVMREEARHILFFVNWVAWRRRTMPLWRRPWFEAKVLMVWAFLVLERIGVAREMDASPAADDANFILTGAKEFSAGMTFEGLARRCLAENARRLAPYDPRLVRPRFVPALVGLALRFAAGRRSAPARG